LLADRNLDFEISTTATPVHTHDWMLRELSRNLLHNAIKHCPPGGTLKVSLDNANQQALLCISDSGPGIGAELRERLFQPFSAGEARSGSGLGLAICNEIVLALGGRISLDNRVSDGHICGLDATVLLPLADNHAA
jgi:two-component system sensor histidine kinase TctE